MAGEITIEEIVVNSNIETIIDKIVGGKTILKAAGGEEGPPGAAEVVVCSR